MTSASLIATPEEAIGTLDRDMSVSEDLHGFGGLHGGIGVAMGAQRLRDSVGDDDKPLRSVHARFVRPIRNSLSIEDTQHQKGRLVDSAATSLSTDGKLALMIDATFGRPSMVAVADQPSMPDVKEPAEYDEFMIPTEFVPFAQFLEIRPTTVDRPFAAGESSQLQAWIRLLDDEVVDLARLIVLFDSLAPSAAASLTDFVAIPTIELTVRPSPNLSRTSSPWILLDTVSVVSEDGWVDETLTAWGPNGDHLGSARQLRLMTSI